MVDLSTRTRQALAAALLLAIGGGTGAAVTHATQPVAVMAPVAPVRIAALANTPQPWFGAPIATVRGRIAEVYGDRFVIDDGSGRMLVELGPEARGSAALAKGQIVTVEGRQDDGVIRAMFLLAPDGRAYAFGPRGGPGHHHGGRPERPEGKPPVPGEPAPGPPAA